MGGASGITVFPTLLCLPLQEKSAWLGPCPEVTKSPWISKKVHIPHLHLSKAVRSVQLPPISTPYGTKGSYSFLQHSRNSEERALNCCTCYMGCWGGRMSADEQKLGLVWGDPCQLRRVFLIDRSLLLLGLEAHIYLFHIGLNLLILFHLCPVQVYRLYEFCKWQNSWPHTAPF